MEEEPMTTKTEDGEGGEVIDCPWMEVEWRVVKVEVGEDSELPRLVRRRKKRSEHSGDII